MWFETFVEIGRADDGVHDGCDDQQDGDNGEEGQWSSSSNVLKISRWLIHAHELEKEVGQTTDVKRLDTNVSICALDVIAMHDWNLQ